MELITKDTAGVLPLPDDFTGHNVVLRPDAVSTRYRHAYFQILLNVGGFGCDVHNMGSKVFGTGLDGSDEQFRRNDIMGVASEELVRWATTQPNQPFPIDLTDMCYMALGEWYYAQGSTQEEAVKAWRKQAGKRGRAMPSIIYHCHRETRINEVYLQWPDEAPEPKVVWQKPDSFPKARKGE